ncbi:hypothetical protein BJ170DRAFT_686229 [Xylariales sp. AK1849]|nr:hypothetical protein BJ170DRAFT_686229 [Xylariales sp. AK1849]
MSQLGGIGGLAAAGYFRAQHNVTVLERSQLDFSKADDDYGLSVVANAFGLLQKAGVRFENLDTVVMTHIWVRNHQNEEVKTVSFDTRSRFGGAPSVLAKRARIQSELLRLATSLEFPGKPVNIIRGARVTQVDVVAGKVVVEGGRMLEGDLIIGADGLNSLVRSAVFQGSNIQPTTQTHDLMLFMTQVPLKAIQAIPDLAYLADPKTAAGLASCDTAEGPEGKKRILIYNVSPRELQVLGYTTLKEFAEKFDSAKASIIKDIPTSRVVEEFAPDFSSSLVDLFKLSRIDAWKILDISPIDQWFRGKALLIGDAAHAVTPHAGQGCNITIEDAEALGHLLKGVDSAEKTTAALERFVSLRRDRAHYVSTRSRELGYIQTDEEKSKGPIGPEAFAKTIYGYEGAEDALKGLDVSSQGK